MTQLFVIEGGTPLRGTVAISGSKNAALPLMMAAMLAEGPTVFENVPDLRDIRAMIGLLEHLNARVDFRQGTLTVDPQGFDTNWVPAEMMSAMRASMYAFGPMIARLGRASVSKPGGCNIGDRPIDLHLRGFRALGVRMDERQGYIHSQHDGLVGADFSLLGPCGTSVGATCNVLMAASLARGTTVLRDAAQEPEVQELCHYLNAMGARIDGIGTGTLTIEGVERLHGTHWRVIPDRIEAITFAVAALMTDGDLVLRNIEPAHMESSLQVLERWGADMEFYSPDALRIRRCPGLSPQAQHITTEPYPGLPTDVQPVLLALLGLTPGRSVLKETIYPGRFLHVDEMNRQGALMQQTGDGEVTIQGVSRYHGGDVVATDLRAGAALVLAGLAAEGETRVHNITHIDRGYEQFERKLAAVGGHVRRMEKELAGAPLARTVRATVEPLALAIRLADAAV